MSGFVCLNCKNESEIFRLVIGGVRGLVEDMGVLFLGVVLLDLRIWMVCDYGESYFDLFVDSFVCKVFYGVVWNVVK